MNVVQEGNDAIVNVWITNSTNETYQIVNSQRAFGFTPAETRIAIYSKIGATASRHEFDNLVIRSRGSNNLPTLDVIGNRVVDEDISQQTVNLSGITAGGGENQPLRVTASSNNAGLIPNPTVNYTSANTTGSLSFTPVANQSGTAALTVTVEDGGPDGNLSTTGDNATFSRTFQVTVNPVNDAPTLDTLGDLAINEDAPQQTVNLMGITAGGNESQPLRVAASSNNTGLIPNPTVNYSSANNTGSLSFTPVPNQAGVATITVTVEDAGLDGDLSTTGDNATFSRTLTISVGNAIDVFLDVQTVTQGTSGGFTGNLNGIGVIGSITVPYPDFEINRPAYFFDYCNSYIEQDSRQYRYADVYSATKPLTDQVGRNWWGGFGSATLRVVFDSPVVNPTIHFANIDRTSYTFAYSGGLQSLQFLKGNNGLDGDGISVVGNVVADAIPSTAVDQSVSDQPFMDGTPRSAYGSVLLQGNISFLDIVVTGVNGGGDGGSFTLSVDAVLNRPPTDISLNSNAIQENAGSNATVGILSTTDPDPGNTFTYTLVPGSGSADNGAFNINGSTLRANDSFDFETKSSYSLRVRSTDQGGLFIEKVLSINVTNINDAPTLNPLSNLTVSRNAPLQTINLSGITAGGGESQPLRVSASSDNSALIPNPNVNYSSANNTGSISFTPVPNQAGVATITVTVEDGGLDGDLSTTGDNAAITRTFTVSVGGSQWLYYLENGVLSRSSPDGSNPTALVQSTEQGWAIKNFDLDTVNNRIYYAEENGVSNSRILSVDMLGQNPIMISQNAAGKGNYSMAVDGLNQAVYLHSHDVPPLAPAGPFFEGRIQKISYQGVLALLPPVLWYVHDMEIDAAANTLYFTADVNSEGLFKCDLNGNAITSLSNDSGVMRNIAISRLRNKIIYTNVNDTNNTSSIFIMNPDGTEKVKLGDYVGAGIDDVELDDEAGLIYFATTLDGIFKTSLTTFAPVQVLPGEKKEIELYFASNTPPTIDVIGNRTVYRNAPQQTVSLSGITAGGGELQPLRVTASSNNTGLIPNPTVNYSSANTTGSLSFTPVANQTGTATITVTVEDGGNDGDLNTTGDNATFSRTFQVNVNRISDVPVLTNLGSDVSYRENVVTARLCNAVQVADADTQVFANGTLQIAIESGGESADRLWLTNSKYLTVNGNGLYFNGLLVGTFSGGTNGQPLEVTFNNRASVNRVQHVLRCVCFAHDSEAPQSTQRVIAIQLNDGAGGQAAATKRVNVIPVDDRLALTGVPVTSTYTLNSTVIRIAPAAVLTDPDSPGFGGGSLRVRFTSAADSSNRLLLGGGFTIDANNNVLQNGVIIGTRNAGGGIGMTELQLSFNSKATREVVQQLMRGLSFKTVNGTSKSSRTIEFSLNNGDGGSNIATTRIDVA